MGKGSAGVGLAMATSRDPCGVAGITWKVGAGTTVGVGGGTAAARRIGGARSGARAPTGEWADPVGMATSAIRMSVSTSEGVVLVSCTEDDPTATSSSSSSMGSSSGVEGETERMVGSTRGVPGVTDWEG